MCIRDRLIDTPEDIAVACDRQGISRIEYLSISHKDPDHTRGMRIVEPLGYNCIAGKGTPIQFIAMPEVIDDINAWKCYELYRGSLAGNAVKMCIRDSIYRAPVLSGHLHYQHQDLEPHDQGTAGLPGQGL